MMGIPMGSSAIPDISKLNQIKRTSYQLIKFVLHYNGIYVHYIEVPLIRGFSILIRNGGEIIEIETHVH